MPAIFEKQGFAYFPIPKVACTSIKYALFEAENGFPFKNYRHGGKLVHIHHLYGQNRHDPGTMAQLMHLDRIVLVRDPVKRFLSAYGNRVGYHRELRIEWLLGKHRAAGAIPDPDVHTFIDRLEIYREASGSIRHHTEPMTWFLGTDPSLYSHVYQMEEVPAFETHLSRMFGKPFKTPRLQTEGTKIPVDALSVSERRKIERFYEQDYDCWAGARITT